MTLTLSEADVTAMRDEARRWVADGYGASADPWAGLAALGWLGLAVPERWGGAGADLAAVAAVMEAVGAGLVVEPVAMTGGVVPDLVLRLGSEAQCAALLPRLASGALIATLAHAEPGAGHDRAIVAARVETAGASLRLVGTKCAVPAADAAHLLFVTARGPQGDLGVWQVDPAAPGVRMAGFRALDGRRMADIAFEGVALPGDARLGVGDATEALDDTLDAAGLLAAAEALGAMDAAFADTAAYLQLRQQFGRKLSQFQALQHRLVDAFLAREEARAALAIALRLRDAPRADRTAAAAMARSVVCRAGHRIGREAIQLHGGIGMTEDLRVGRLFKRILTACSLYGDADWCAARFARQMPAAEARP
ncbi:MAG: acyl-CoA dehydrogenase family protein [Alkalilacustris sp.]